MQNNSFDQAKATHIPLGQKHKFAYRNNALFLKLCSEHALRTPTNVQTGRQPQIQSLVFPQSAFLIATFSNTVQYIPQQIEFVPNVFRAVEIDTSGGQHAGSADQIDMVAECARVQTALG